MRRKQRWVWAGGGCGRSCGSNHYWLPFVLQTPKSASESATEGSNSIGKVDQTPLAPLVNDLFSVCSHNQCRLGSGQHQTSAASSNRHCHGEK